MDFITVFLVGVGLAMDAFAVSVCKGLAVKTPKLKEYLLVGLWFGGFQALMPVLGYLLGSAFYDAVSSYAYIIAIGLLVIIGANMILEAVRGGDEEDIDGNMGMKVMAILAVATSIDAFAVGISMAMYESEIVPAAVIIGLVTSAISAAGMKAGSVFGNIFGHKADILGGIILLCIALKIALEHFVL